MKTLCIVLRDTSTIFQWMKMRSEGKRNDLRITEGGFSHGTLSVRILGALQIEEGAQCTDCLRNGCRRTRHTSSGAIIFMVHPCRNPTLFDIQEKFFQSTFPLDTGDVCRQAITPKILEDFGCFKITLKRMEYNTKRLEQFSSYH